jgi:hypothetical protein
MMRRLGQAQRRPNNRIGWCGVGSSLRSSELTLGATRLITVLPMVAIAAAPMAYAQEQTPERRLVQAFSAYCITTSAEPGRIGAAIKAQGSFQPNVATFKNGGRILSAEVMPRTGWTDPHQRLVITYGWGLGDNGRKRSCQVNLPWGDKAKLVAEVVANLNLAGGASSVVREGQYDTDVTRWTTRIGSLEAVIELGMPTYSGAAGRALTLSLEEP